MTYWPKSFPPRMLLTLLAGLLGFVFMAGAIIVGELWSEVDPAEPHKAFLVQVWDQTRQVLASRSSHLRARQGSRNAKSLTPDN